jgi:hypothetical protein
VPGPDLVAGVPVHRLLDDDWLVIQNLHLRAEHTVAEHRQVVADDVGATTVASDARRTDAAQRLNALYQSWGRPQEAEKYAASLPVPTAATR